MLLADDRAAMLALTTDALAGECVVDGSVGDGRELLAEAERFHPDVIVLDITMARLDGIEAARQLSRSTSLRAWSSSRSTKTRLRTGRYFAPSGHALPPLEYKWSSVSI